MTKRVVVWGTGFVGKMVIAELVKHPRFDLVGVGVSNPEKVGRDVGEICGLGRPLGLNAGPSILAETRGYGEDAAKRFGLGFSAADREENVRRIGDSHDECGMTVDVAGDDGSCRVIAFVIRRDDGTAHLGRDVGECDGAAHGLHR